MRKKKQVFPPGWDEKRVRQVIAHYEQQTEEEQVAEHEAAAKTTEVTMMAIPIELVPQVRELIARRDRAS
jgi:predicted dinucleotide-binding enzyme